MVTVKWLVDMRIIFIQADGEVSLDDAAKMNDAIVSLLAEGDEPIHLMFFVTEVQFFPTNIFWLRNNMSFINHPKVGHNIAIITNPFIRYISSVIYKTIRESAPYFVSSYEEGCQKLSELDTSLPELPQMPSLSD